MSYYSMDYIHVDVADDFSFFGKASTTALFLLAFWVSKQRCGFSQQNVTLLTLCGACLLIVWRYALEQLGQGPIFRIERAVFLPGIFYLVGAALLRCGLTRMQHWSQLCGTNIKANRCYILAVALVGGSVFGNETTIGVFSESPTTCLTTSAEHIAMISCAHIASALTMTGNLSNFLIVTSFVYDDIGFTEFATNMLMPCFVAWTISVTIVGIVHFSDPTGSESTTQYHVVKEQNHFLNESDETFPQFLWNRARGVSQSCIVVGYVALLCLGFSPTFLTCAFGIAFLVSSLNLPTEQSADRIDVASAEEEIPPQDDDEEHDFGTHQQSKPSSPPVSADALAGVDWTPLLVAVSHMIMTAVWVDTGVPQIAFYRILGRQYAEWPTSPEAKYPTALLVSVSSGLVFNGPVTAQMMAATLPYASPYDWLYLCFVISMANNWTGGHSIRSVVRSPWPFLKSGVLATVLSTSIGIAVLGFVHFSPECSIRLGECDGRV